METYVGRSFGDVEMVATTRPMIITGAGNHQFISYQGTSSKSYQKSQTSSILLLIKPEEPSDLDDPIMDDKGMKVNDANTEEDLELAEGDAKNDMVDGILTITFAISAVDDFWPLSHCAIVDTLLLDRSTSATKPIGLDLISSLIKGMYTRSLLRFIASAIRPVAKIDWNTKDNTRGQFMRLVVYVEWGKQLFSKVKIVSKIQQVEYESLLEINRFENDFLAQRKIKILNTDPVCDICSNKL
ncbi:hypothetical protein Goari_017458 [Gossypium aridum]|uniref:Uncharacterized protein n=1 Tax=Gossypium aridum TaxID=34290 RepID=A0A7J8WLX3_GOSAI|nr:hypothetical protein [Gossypium aridum]